MRRLATCRRPDGTRCRPTEIFRVLADPNRVALLERLIARGPEMQSVSELARACPVDFSVVSRHLKQLRDAGVIEAKRVGKHVYYGVRAREVASVLRRLADALETCCQDDSSLAPAGGADRRQLTMACPAPRMLVRRSAGTGKRARPAARSAD
jgi:ArsR family transcriptional regulator, arsenate/arsenite/antimonite-responsive transcriptional repressor